MNKIISPYFDLDYDVFFDSIRKTIFKSLKPSQVSGINFILAEAKSRSVPLGDLAYMLSTTYWETGRTMQPIHELGSRSYFNKYEPGTRIGKRLGNVKKGDGYLYRGRGYVQLTGRDNYMKATVYFREVLGIAVDFVKNPDQALQPEYAAIILFVGMAKGWFTGKDLDDYIDNVDEDDKEDLREFSNARRIINGVDHQVEIGQFSIAFEHALKAAKYGMKAAIKVEPAKVEKEDEPANTPVLDAFPAPVSVPAPVGSPGLVAALLAAIVTTLIAAWSWLVDVPCNLIGMFCGS